MNYLLDTNILLEAVFRQEKAARVNRFLKACNKQGQGLLISSFTLDSIGVMMLTSIPVLRSMVLSWLVLIRILIRLI